MTEETKKQICKSYHYGFTVKDIAYIERGTEDEINQALKWGEDSGYFDELNTEVKEAE